VESRKDNLILKKVSSILTKKVLTIRKCINLSILKHFNVLYCGSFFSLEMKKNKDKVETKLPKKGMEVPYELLVDIFMTQLIQGMKEL